MPTVTSLTAPGKEYNLKNKRIFELCFESVEPHKYKCKLCISTNTIIQKDVNRNGYQAFIQHLTGKAHVDTFLQYCLDIEKAQDPHLVQQNLSNFLDPHVTNVFNWMHQMSKLDLPYSWTTDETFLSMSKLKKIDRETLQKHQINTGLLMEQRFAKTIRHTKGPNKGQVKPFVLMLDMWDDGSGRKDIACWLVFENENYEEEEESDEIIENEVKTLPFKQYLLCLTPLLDASTSNGDSQIRTIEEALRRVDLKWSDVLLVVADNTNVNPSICRKQSKPLIGCRSHIIALAVKSMLAKYEKKTPLDQPKILDKIHELCKTMRATNMRGRLRQLDSPCELTPFIRGHKWPATYSMLTRFHTMKPSIDSVLSQDDIDDDISGMMLTNDENRQYKRIMNKLTPFMQVEQVLQKRGINPHQSRVMFDGLLASSLSDAEREELHHLKADDNIIMDPIFDSGLVKIIKGEEKNLTNAEREKMRKFRKQRADSMVNEDEDEDEENDPPSVNFGVDMLHLAKKQRVQLSSESEYINLAWIPATTCEVERTFSVCKRIYSEFRKNMSPEILEILIYLRLNREYWDINTVAVAVRDKRFQQAHLF